MSNDRPTLAPHGRTVIVVDDEHHIRAVVVAKLKADGFDVREASDGEEALEQARAQPPTIVVSDLQMPIFNGLQLARALHAEVRMAQVPVILLTARGHLLTESDLATPNIARVISKPFSARELLKVVNEVVRPDAAAGLAA